MSNTAIAATMAALFYAGGAMGFAKKGSKASLIAGCVVGSVYAFLAFKFNTAAATQAFYNQIAVYFSAVLALGMGYRYLKSRATVPLVLTLLGVGATGGFFLQQ